MSSRKSFTMSEMVTMYLRCLLLFGVATGLNHSVPVPVDSTLGKIIGEEVDGVNVFLGIPYAKPPRRWRDPVYPSPFTKDYVADTLKPMCTQNPCNDRLRCTGSTSEDCLYMNIFVPADACQTNPKAVMFYIHGGSFVSSTGLARVHFGNTLAKQGDVVVVTINYRLGVFGFLATGASGTNLTGNYGIKDQRMALRWVNKNIKKFGGDPRKVTIFGDSAGAQSIGIHLTNGKSDAFYKACILLSPPFTVPFRSLYSARFQTQVIAQIVGCSVQDLEAMISCLRGVNATTLLQAQNTFLAERILISSSELVNTKEPIGPVIDKDWVPASLTTAFHKGMENVDKPVLMGTTKEEAVLFLKKEIPPISYIKVQGIIRGSLLNRNDRPPKVKELLKNYPLSHPNSSFFDAREEFAEITTDFVFTCPTRKVAKHIELKKGKAWLYFFDVALNSPDLLQASPQCIGRACHGVELPFVFNIFRFLDIRFKPMHARLAEKVVGYFSNFAKFGNPNHSSVNLPIWTRFGPGNHLIFKSIGNPVMGQIKDIRGSQCKLWDEIGYYDFTPINKYLQSQIC